MTLQTFLPTAFNPHPFVHRMDLHEDKNNNTVTANFELPGLKKEDVHIDVHSGRLTVAAESKISSDHEQSGYAVRERRFGKFSRTLQLPQGVKVRNFGKHHCSLHTANVVRLHRTKRSRHPWRTGS